MTYRWTDPDGNTITIRPDDHPDGPHISIQIRHWATSGAVVSTATARIPCDRSEELIAGLRDTVRQAATEEQPA